MENFPSFLKITRSIILMIFLSALQAPYLKASTHRQRFTMDMDIETKPPKLDTTWVQQISDYKQNDLSLRLFIEDG